MLFHFWILEFCGFDLGSGNVEKDVFHMRFDHSKFILCKCFVIFNFSWLARCVVRLHRAMDKMACLCLECKV